MDEQILEFEIEKETPGTYRYREIEADGHTVIGSLYLRKEVAGRPGPKRLRVTIEELD